MREQIHGGDIYRNQNVVDFSVNSNPLGPPEAVIKAIYDNIKNITHYPDMECESLRDAIGKYEQMYPKNILCGNGAAELFYAVSFATIPKHALLLAPTFSEYEKALKAVGTEISYYKLNRAYGFLVQEEILQQITPELDIVFFCNPNNPTGLLTEPDLLQRIILKCEENQVLFVLDECFLDFLEDAKQYEMKELCDTCKYLLIVKAFTKIFCIPGLRLGYCLSGNLELLARMRSVMQAWNVSVLAQISGIAALDNPEEYLKETRRFVREQGQYMKQELENAGYKVYPSKANYLFLEGKKGLYEEALEAGFLIRNCQNYIGLEEGAYRIAVRTKEENERIITWLKQL